MNKAPVLLILSALVGAGCTSVPTPSTEFQASGDALSAAKGFRSKRIATAPPNPPVPEGAILTLKDVTFSDSVANSQRLSRDNLELVANALARNICSDLSKQFEISDAPDVKDAYSLRMKITQLTPTSRLGTLVGTATGLVAPIGVRPPIGLGSLTAEFELVRPDGSLAAAMVWSKRADMLSDDANLSSVGDAYSSTAGASSDFAALVQSQKTGTQRVGAALSQRVGAALRSPFGAKSDPACEKYGKGEGFLEGLSPVPLPPRGKPSPAKP